MPSLKKNKQKKIKTKREAVVVSLIGKCERRS